MNTPSNALHDSQHRASRAGITQLIFDDLRQRILDGQFVRGGRLPTEKQLVAHYGVSVASLREAIRGLASAGFVEVRHGKGIFVTASAEDLIANSLNSMIQIEKVGMAHVLGVHGALNTYASELAAARATPEDVETMQKALIAVDHGVAPEDIAEGLTRFLNALVRASGNPLLVSLCQFLTTVQIGLAREIQGKRFEAWRKTAARLSNGRQRIVDAIRIGDVDGARVAARAFHEHSISVFTALPKANDAVVHDLAVSTFFSKLLQQMMR
jgi:GntR family transcriptional repressor for pyruvate dehydrogenase complex